MSLPESKRWWPNSMDDRELVQRELNVILASSHFRNSKRYPTLLSYIITKTLDGETDRLKERTLGVEVFGRSPDYDTSAEPIVRVTAAEIRKRLAQHYHERGHGYGLEVDLPLGSYVPSFKRDYLSEEPAGMILPEAAPAAVAAVPPHRETSGVLPFAFERKRFQFRYIAMACLLLILVGSAGYFVQQKFLKTASEEFWEPLLRSSVSVLTVVPTSMHDNVANHDQNGVNLTSVSHGPYNHISICDAVALTHVASFLGKHAKTIDIKEADRTGIGDLHNRSVILLGGINNNWTKHLTESMRFHFVEEPLLVRIADTENPRQLDWSVDYTRPYAYAKHDYAIIARYVDPATGGNTVVIAGIGAHATQAAGEFVATASALEQIRHFAAAGWEHKNLEMIVRTDVINGDSGPAQLIAVATW